MMMKKASGGDSPLRQGAGKTSGPSRSRVDDAGGLQYIFWKMDQVLGLSHRGEYIGRRAMSGGGPGSTPCPGAATGWPAPWGVWPPSGPPLFLLWTPSRVGKIETLAFVSSNSENISCVTFLKHKTAENRELALWHLINRLILENA
jgi:hypothetical protein